jgi:hypothetical protein
VRYRVDYTHIIKRFCYAYVDADNEEDAIEKVKNADDEVNWCDEDEFHEDGIRIEDYEAVEDAE